MLQRVSQVAVLVVGFSTPGLIPAAPPASGPAQGKANRLAKESSPYLLQHAYNPVDWYPWGPEAFEQAKKQNKLIFLSIGYSSCHWCHVMERESFSNPEIAQVMNDHFICIKVDREERPDIDDIYMTALQVTDQQGGWPLTMILTPEGKPIFGGTYFPPTDKKVGDDEIPGMKSILARVIELDRKERPELIKQADHIAKLTIEALDRNQLGVALVKLDRELVKAAVEAFEIDPEHGGLGSKARQFRGTKFPRPPVWGLLLRESRRPDQAELAKLVQLTLHKMAEGGIYDHLGGGFHRYSTERTWTVPHFEKMLYDNAQLVELYSEAHQLWPDPLYRRTVEETLAFIDRELTSPAGAFYSALDADTNHKEGEFYFWTVHELKKVLGSDDAAFFMSIYGERANFEDQFIIPRLSQPLRETAQQLKLSEDQLLARLAPLKNTLFEARSKRERPFLDTKVICAWNGQMIAGYAKAGEVFKKPDYIQRARRAAEFVLTKLRTKDGRLYRVYAAVPGELPAGRGFAFLDDYTYLVHGLLNLHDATGEKRWLEEARQLTEIAMKYHRDGNRGGYFFTASDAEKLFARARDSYDGVQPSGNSQMARNLLRLWQKTKEEPYRELCVKTLKAFGLPLRLQPATMPTMVRCLDEYLEATGDESTNGTGKAVPPIRPKESADVVSAKLELGVPRNAQTQDFTLTLTIAPGWHIYANPVDNEALKDSQTVVRLLANGQLLTSDFKLVMPKGKATTDSSGATYAIYEGTITITGTVPVTKDLEVRVKLVACREGQCLVPSLLKVK
jgi:uncharacterized protein YyaL (SSP411 family)